MKKISKMTLDTDYKKNVSCYFSWLPFIGLIVSIFSALFMLVKGKEPSLMLVLYTLIPLVGNSFLSFLIYISFRKTLNFNLPFFKGKKKFLTISLITCFMLIEIIIFS
ncbi:hypothetical protein [Anaerosacchariphilus polymeriproducens]|uniref:Uncharacterized protein n=1 Tax=Anaerosacchariphilus polymeriproducens TaxID=1812858 RepID=A0A371AZT5_9FIRM|nr:hypothetical protein [Anaerosacchariphilus polymeriproducens]RDU25114.1 hypothetical protein DWV06_01040 [Anaerosacchariphilus polymeriproducens]